MTSKKTSKTPPTPKIDEIFRELESIASKIETDQLSLEASLAAFEKGIQLTRQAQASLSEAEQKVNCLIEQEGAATETEFLSTENKD